MDWKKQYHAVLIATPANEPNRLYAHADGHVALWETADRQKAFDAQKLLDANGVAATVVVLDVKVVG